MVEIHHCSMTKDKKIQMDIEWGNNGSLLHAINRYYTSIGKFWKYVFLSAFGLSDEVRTLNDQANESRALLLEFERNIMKEKSHEENDDDETDESLYSYMLKDPLLCAVKYQTQIYRKIQRDTQKKKGSVYQRIGNQIRKIMVELPKAMYVVSVMERDFYQTFGLSLGETHDGDDGSDSDNCFRNTYKRKYYSSDDISKIPYDQNSKIRTFISSTFNFHALKAGALDTFGKVVQKEKGQILLALKLNKGTRVLPLYAEFGSNESAFECEVLIDYGQIAIRRSVKENASFSKKDFKCICFEIFPNCDSNKRKRAESE